MTSVNREGDSSDQIIHAACLEPPYEGHRCNSWLLDAFGAVVVHKYLYTHTILFVRSIVVEQHRTLADFEVREAVTSRGFWIPNCLL